MEKETIGSVKVAANPLFLVAAEIHQKRIFLNKESRITLNSQIYQKQCVSNNKSTPKLHMQHKFTASFSLRARARQQKSRHYDNIIS